MTHPPAGPSSPPPFPGPGRMSIQPLRLRAFIAQIDSTNGPDACWMWRGHTNSDGYGIFGKGSEGAHRVAYELMVRPVPDGLNVDHQCHNTDQTASEVVMSEVPK